MGSDKKKHLRSIICGMQQPDYCQKLEAKLQGLERECQEMGTELLELQNIGIALSAEHKLQNLLELILSKSREITNADAGSIYIIENSEKNTRRLRFKLSQNYSLNVPFKEFTLPLDKKSIAGYVAVTGETLRIDDVYNIPSSAEYSFYQGSDKEIGYRCKSMLIVPMHNHKNEIVGVVQVINKKSGPNIKLSSPNKVLGEVIPFTEKCEQMISSLASQAAVSIENDLLYENIEKLLEGFVTASVSAIESRDPATSGHSLRVAALTVGLAEAVTAIKSGPFKTVFFSAEELREMRYAGLLHDMGKVGVSEKVLLKEKKLYDHEMNSIKERFERAKLTTRLEYLEQRLAVLEKSPKKTVTKKQLKELEDQTNERIAELDRYLELVSAANEPHVLATEISSGLKKIADVKFRDLDGKKYVLINPDELAELSIPRGTLSNEERSEIESHVTHSFKFLSQIPWTKDLKAIPQIAISHHEKLDGTGYPKKLPAKEIAIQARMMAIADIFDALTASDRPYKKAMPVEKALKILAMEAESGKLDQDLLDVFISKKVYLKSKPKSE